ncbi:MAG: DNA-directed RNA polymerase subunit alpha [Patescibacteria group bacterium]|nr:DNA-directed RNA polymerase subunit alpha [Patescibacteria group bacterium]
MLYDIHLPELKKIKEEGNKGTFEIAPLYPGYGMTLGNSLRRVILSSLPGSAITAVKIHGAAHEFSTLPNVKEDVIEIILNLKQLRVKLHSEEETITLSKSGKGLVTAADIKENQNVEVVNKDLYIATLDNSKAKIDIEIKVEKGRGFVPIEKREGEKLGVGMIAVDALYAPIKRVRYTVEKTRVGQMTDLDKLVLDVETDGTVSAEAAIKHASEILVDHFLVLTDKETVEKRKKIVEEEIIDNVAAGILIEEINLSPRTTNALLNNELRSIEDVLKITANELKNLKGFGAKAYDEVIEKVKELGFEMKKEEAEE